MAKFKRNLDTLTWRHVAAVVVMGLFVARAEAQSYTVTLKPSGDDALDAMLKDSSMLVALSKTKTGGIEAFCGRVRGDYTRLATALQSAGYYSGQAHIELILPNGHHLSGKDLDLPDRLRKLTKKEQVNIEISAERGPQYRIGRILLVNSQSACASLNPFGCQISESGQARKCKLMSCPQIDLSAKEQRAFGLDAGQAADAGRILQAQSALLAQLRDEGHALAKVDKPIAYVEPQTHQIDLKYVVEKGPIVAIGPIDFEGQKRTRLSFLKRRLRMHSGELYQPDRIEQARQDLASIGIFSSVGVHDSPPLVGLARGEGISGVTQAMPLVFTLKEAPLHSVSAQAGFSTDLGGRAGASWEHHNLFRSGQRLKLTALITGLGGSAQQGLGYDVYADYLSPDFYRRGQNLSLRIEGVRQLLYSYHQTAFLVRGGLARRLTKYWNGSASLSAEQERITQFGVERTYLVAAIPINATYDDTEVSNPIDPATHGVRINLGATPSESLENGHSFFTTLTVTASTYFDFSSLGVGQPGRSVIALRGMLGSVQGAGTYQIPPDQRLYAGGPATVRGFRYQGIGPQYGKYGIGGTSLDAGTVEYRQRILKKFGAAAFIDAGQVGSHGRPFEGTLRVGYGGGVRYYTPIGPVRVDVAFPVNRPVKGDKWELYFGLGETF